MFTFLKLISEPHSLLLENQGGETGTKGHNKTIKLLLWTKLNLCVAQLNTMYNLVEKKLNLNTSSIQTAESAQELIYLQS